MLRVLGRRPGGGLVLRNLRLDLQPLLADEAHAPPLVLVRRRLIHCAQRRWLAPGAPRGARSHGRRGSRGRRCSHERRGSQGLSSHGRSSHGRGSHGRGSHKSNASWRQPRALPPLTPRHALRRGNHCDSHQQPRQYELGPQQACVDRRGGLRRPGHELAGSGAPCSEQPLKDAQQLLKDARHHHVASRSGSSRPGQPQRGGQDDL
mmetsp:Transcript_69243/g.178471  ORF Transcript_69243/g.178471 Transcript_69243/m.178471 type:complete len:206 (-) Transcript_69243:253-870(-)